MQGEKVERLVDLPPSWPYRVSYCAVPPGSDDVARSLMVAEVLDSSDGSRVILRVRKFSIDVDSKNGTIFSRDIVLRSGDWNATASSCGTLISGCGDLNDDKVADYMIQSSSSYPELSCIVLSSGADGSEIARIAQDEIPGDPSLGMERFDGSMAVYLGGIGSDSSPVILLGYGDIVNGYSCVCIVALADIMKNKAASAPR